MIRVCAYLWSRDPVARPSPPPVTLFVIRQTDELLAVRFACSPVWETLAAVRTLIDRRARAYHRPWHELVRARIAQLDLEPLLAVEPLRGYVPDFISPPPAKPWPRLEEQLAEIRRTEPDRVGRELELCRRAATDDRRRAWLDRLLADPEAARDLLASRIRDAWLALVSPYWRRVRSALAADIAERARTLAERGLRATLDQLDPRIRWTPRGLSIACPDTTTVSVGERGLLLMPSAYSWPHVAAVVDEPWQPTIVYPTRGVAELWQSAAVAPEALARLLGRTRALVLVSLERPSSTTALAARLELSPAGTSRHLVALRDAGLVSPSRHGHEVRYSRTSLGSALIGGAAVR
jgi:DNA-binding transcriptional ArsR family regulator